MIKKSYIINLIMGDPSGDGHGNIQYISIKSNLNKNAIQTAYEKGTKLLGFDFVDKVCADYEDNFLHKEEMNKLVKHGFNVDDLGSITSYEKKEALNFIKNDEMFYSNHLRLWTDSFSNIYLFIAKLGNKNFKYKILDENDSSIDIGGYGLYSN